MSCPFRPDNRSRCSLMFLTVLLLVFPAIAAAQVDAPAGAMIPSSAAARGNDLTPPEAVGTAFTYQGELVDDGTPASGPYDLQFRLFDAAAGGAQIGSTVTVNDILAVNGRFTAEIDFGLLAFGNGARWLAISVRPGASGGSYTTLAPRQKLNGAPFAQALPLVYPDESTGFVGIGRSTQISTAEAFGVNATTGVNGYGGMYINTTEVTGWPFYGYATGGSFRAWTFFDGTTNAWRLFNGAYRLTVPQTGGLIVENVSSGDGIVINQTNDDGIQIGTSGVYPNYGVYMPSPGVPTYGLWPNTSNAAGQWGLYTADNIAAGNVFASAQTLIARVSGPDALNPGDVVAAAGVSEPLPGGTERLARVQLAGGDAPGIVGVVASRMVFDVAPGKEETGERSLQGADGPARDGDYVALVVLGVADVKVDRGASIDQGTRLTAADARGRVRPLRTESLNGMPVAEGAQVIGVALVAARPGADTVPVFVTLK